MTADQSNFMFLGQWLQKPKEKLSFLIKLEQN